MLYELQVKRMSTDIPFILDALRSSHNVEVQVRYLFSSVIGG